MVRVCQLRRPVGPTGGRLEGLTFTTLNRIEPGLNENGRHCASARSRVKIRNLDRGKKAGQV